MAEETPSKTLEELQGFHPADLADYLQRLSPDDAHDILLQLRHSLAAEVLDELEKDQATELLESFTSEQLIALFRELPSNAVADLVVELDPPTRREVLAGLPSELSESVHNLLRYPEDTAGGIMSDRFITLRANHTIRRSLERLHFRGEQRMEEVSYLYVTNEGLRLVGVVSLRDLVFNHPDRKISEIMNPNVRFVRASDDQEELARQFEHYHFIGLPVLDKHDRLVGVVKASDALHVAQAEATEDMQLMVGLSGEERVLTHWKKALRRRLPWLFLNLGTAFMAAGVVGFFESTIDQLPALAIFLPVVAGQGGNAGMQTLTIIVRDLALGELSAGDGKKAIAKELLLGLLNGLAIGLVVGVIGYLWKGNAVLGVVVGLAMLLNLLAAGLAGVFVPYGLKWLRIDPALASSIFVTTVTDVAGFFFFLGLAAIGLRMYVG